MLEDQGRHLTDFKSSTRRDEYIKYINDIWRDDQYRLFLQLNGSEIRKRDWDWNRKNNSCWVNDCVHNYPTRVNPRQMWQERQVYDSVFNLRTNKKLAPMRRCIKYPDFTI